MAFILSSDGRDNDVVGAFGRYKNYLNSTKEKFPQSAYTLATSDWYFSGDNHKSPHDSWLENLTISENAHGDRNQIRYSSMKLRLLGAYHDGFIEMVYPQVFSYQFDSYNCERGHLDWRYDEFRLSDKGHVLHEIEWCSDKKNSIWTIEASDALYQWIPRVTSSLGK